MHELDFLPTIAGVLFAALLFGYATHRLGLSPIVGYLLAGIIIGPYTPGFVANPEVAEQLSHIGVILLMFGVGLHFQFHELWAVRHIALPGAIGQIAVATLLGCLVTLGFGWHWSAGLMYGLAISVASTVVMLRVLVDNNDLHTPTGHIAVGWLIVQDLFTVLVLVLLPAISPQENQPDKNIVLAVGISLLKIGAFLALVVLLGKRILHGVLQRVALVRSRELFTLTVLVVALGIAVLAAQLFGVSIALGAFLAGMIVGTSDFSSRAASEALPMRDAFAVVFFVSVGMLLNPQSLLETPALLAATLGIILIVTPLTALAISIGLRYPIRVGLGVAAALAQICEFSFILAALGRELGLLSVEATNSLIAASIVSISLNPLIYRSVDSIEDKLKRFPRVWNWLLTRSKVGSAAPSNSAAEDDELAYTKQAIVVGYGPVGRTLVQLLRESEIEPTVIELNLQSVQRLRDAGIRAVYGDATHMATLVDAGVKQAIVIILSSSQMQRSDETIRLAREANSEIKVFARANHLREIPALKSAGADVVFAGEGEVALTMNEFLMRQLGATPEQIDLEKDRIREELFGSPATIEILLPVPRPETRSEPPSETEPQAVAPREAEDVSARTEQVNQEADGNSPETKEFDSDSNSDD